MGRTRVFALFAAMLMVGAVVAPFAVFADDHGSGGSGNIGATAGNLAIGVQQGAQHVTVSVTHNGTGVENASLNVSANESWNETGEYDTDEDGFVTLTRPNQTVTATFNATKDNRSGSTTETIQGSAGEGPDSVPFGQFVSAFVQSLHEATAPDKPLGQLISSMVRDNNPAANGGAGGASSQGTGPPDERGPPSDGDDDRGPPSDASANGDDSDRGPPEDRERGPPHSGDRGPSTQDDRGPSADDDRGPPDHARDRRGPGGPP